jgi:energy-coupling factor transporter transmembrane protein EcfT
MVRQHLLPRIIKCRTTNWLRVQDGETLPVRFIKPFLFAENLEISALCVQKPSYYKKRNGLVLVFLVVFCFISSIFTTTKNLG